MSINIERCGLPPIRPLPVGYTESCDVSPEELHALLVRNYDGYVNTPLGLCSETDWLIENGYEVQASAVRDDSDQLVAHGRLVMKHMTGVLSYLVVSGDHSNKGIGRHLVGSRVHTAEQRGIVTLRTSELASDTLVDYYKSFGFSAMYAGRKLARTSAANSARFRASS